MNLGMLLLNCSQSGDGAEAGEGLEGLNGGFLQTQRMREGLREGE